jgi:hypothetical protein
MDGAGFALCVSNLKLKVGGPCFAAGAVVIDYTGTLFADGGA